MSSKAGFIEQIDARQLAAIKDFRKGEIGRKERDRILKITEARLNILKHTAPDNADQLIEYFGLTDEEALRLANFEHKSLREFRNRLKEVGLKALSQELLNKEKPPPYGARQA